ncbi:MAG: hypothetical protein IH851_04900 [Armatimonadetes bacterium]|nr:hypothetical protein [Armatimonadota bacterium]
MHKVEGPLAVFLTVLLVVFMASLVGCALGLVPVWWPGLTVLAALIAVSWAFLVSQRKSRGGRRRRVIAKIHSTWRTDQGQVIPPYQTELEEPAYHVVLVTDQNERIEVATAEPVWRECIEESWGWADLQGNWMGSYQRDPELYRRYSGR